MKNLLIIFVLTMIGLSSHAQNIRSHNKTTETDSIQVVRKTIPLEDGIITFTGYYWSSVGHTYYIEFDEEAFTSESKITYKHPEDVEAGMCGGDEGSRSFTLKPTKKGEFTVTEIFGFRGEERKRIKNIVTVK